MVEKLVPPRLTPDRDSKYMGLAWIIASFSKDPSTQHGSIIVDENNIPLGSGYNGPPADIDDEHCFNWVRPEKYKYILHAEDNAMEHSHGKVEGSTIYVTGLPCSNCMIRIVRKKIYRVVYMDRDYDPQSMLATEEYVKESLKIAKDGGVRVEKFQGNINWLKDWLLHLTSLGVFK